MNRIINTLDHHFMSSPCPRLFASSRPTWKLQTRKTPLPASLSPSLHQQTTPQAWTKHKITWNGYETTYATAGCGTPILLVHGFGASYRHYRRIIPELAKTHKVYALDLLGFGESEKPLIDYTMDVWAEQIQDFMTEMMQQQPAILVGNSIGSLAVMMVSASQKDAVRGIVLLNCAGGMNNKAISDDFRIKLAMPIFLLIDFLLGQKAIARYLFDKFRAPDNLRQILLNVYPGKPESVDDELIDLLYQPSCDDNALETFVSVVTGPDPGPRPEDLVDDIKAPMLILWGDKDPFTPSDGPVGQWFQNLPSHRGETKFVHLPGIGHCPMDEDPDAVLGEMLPWLERLT